MRKDMRHKIVERPRYGGEGRNAHRRNRTAIRDATEEQLEAMPTKEGIRRRHILHWGGKELNENLNPLYRYLNKQAGRPWNDVYSEICEQVRPDSAVQLHILQHVFDVVEIHVKFVDGVACHANRKYWSMRSGEWPIEGYRNGSFKQMYVDPRDGILRLAPDRAPYRRKTQDPDLYIDKNNIYVQYRRIKGVWYEITFRDIEDGEIVTHYWRDGQRHAYREWARRSSAWDFLAGSSDLRIYDIERNYGRAIVPVRKRQLNSKEIKRLGL